MQLKKEKAYIIIDRLDLTTMKNQVEPGSTEAPQGFMDKYNKKKCK